MKISQDTPFIDNEKNNCIKVNDLKKKYDKGKDYVVNGISFAEIWYSIWFSRS